MLFLVENEGRLWLNWGTSIVTSSDIPFKRELYKKIVYSCIFSFCLSLLLLDEGKLWLYWFNFKVASSVMFF